MSDLSTQLGPLRLRNPVVTASGTFGFGQEYAAFMGLSRLGAITTKATTLLPKEGNPSPRICETPAGMLNAIGLQNPGIEAFLLEKLPFLREAGTTLIVNIAGEKVDDYVALASRLDEAPGVDALELNVSCPNVAHGGMQFGISPPAISELVSAVRAATKLPLITKLSPNVTDIVSMARAAVEAGSDILSLINTLVGIAVDVDRRRPVLANITGGLSGPAIRPVAVRMVWQVWAELRVPIIGMGGVMTATDALEFILAGATAVGIGTANFVDPATGTSVIDGLHDYCEANGVASIAELIGAAH
jgi:dihydroorotate dehydrogenase (NAD+) catalytic subunit